MKRINAALLLFIFITTIFLTGCSAKKVEYVEVMVPIKCKVPDVPRANIRVPSSNFTNVELIEMTVQNYNEYKTEVLLLREAINTCK